MDLVSYIPYVLIALIVGFTAHVILSRRKTNSKQSGKKNGSNSKLKADVRKSWFSWIRWPYITTRGAFAVFAYGVAFLLLVVIGEEIFFDRDYRPERVTLPIGCVFGQLK